VDNTVAATTADAFCAQFNLLDRMNRGHSYSVTEAADVSVFVSQVCPCPSVVSRQSHICFVVCGLAVLHAVGGS
jgi:hypothetical protein